MKTCNNCGTALAPEAVFCMKCGTKASAPVLEPVKPICPACNNEVADGSLFCDKCGHKLGLAGSLKIICLPHYAPFIYEVIVNGQSHGEITLGKTIDAGAVSDPVTVEISSKISTEEIHVGHTLKLTLRPRPGGNPKIAFKCDFVGYPLAAVHDAEILESERN